MPKLENNWLTFSLKTKPGGISIVGVILLKVIISTFIIHYCMKYRPFL